MAISKKTANEALPYKVSPTGVGKSIITEAKITANNNQTGFLAPAKSGFCKPDFSVTELIEFIYIFTSL